MQRLQLILTGLLQGIGFRPYVYRLAVAHQLSGFVANQGAGVLIEIEGTAQQQAAFLIDLQSHIPACGHISQIQQRLIPITYQHGFQLKPSLINDEQSALFVCPDIAVCADCVAELFDKHNRRYQHPFISCCHCGPRYSVMTALPYDREHTTLCDFPLCASCAEEYQNPHDRRFHAQTIACPDCGPQLSFCDSTGKVLKTGQGALQHTVNALAAGHIIAVKGIGGFQIMVAAENGTAVARLRQLKHRASKPFAVMVNQTQAETLAELSEQERQLLNSAAAPIVLVNAKPSLLLDYAAPHQTVLGLMLAAAPLQHLLLAELQQPLIATSGNRHGEPICIDNNQAVKQLSGLVDGFLSHDRAILRPLDDAIVRVIANIPTVLRRARGYVPTPLELPDSITTTLAVGGQLKNTVAIADKQHVILSQHLGDLQQLETIEQHRATIADLQQFYQLKPQHIVCDHHSDYISTQLAHSFQQPIHHVQHHYAHILSAMAEHQLKPPVLGVAWDGIGLGLNHDLWGGEFLHITKSGWQRVAHCRPFPLIGGSMAIKEPRRAALGLLYAAFGEMVFESDFQAFLTAFTDSELKLLQGLLKKQLNCPMTSSIGRLFDAFASLLGLCQINEFEGQAAMALESTASGTVSPLQGQALDWQPLLETVLFSKQPKSQLAALIHHTLAHWLFQIAEQIGETRLVLSGGCFQNAYLMTAIKQHPQAKNYQVIQHSRIPPNDGGLALGQIYARLLETT